MNQARRALEIIGDCLESISFVDSMCWLFGISGEEIPSNKEIAQKLLKKRQELTQLLEGKRKGIFIWKDEDLKTLREIANRLQENRSLWKNGPVKVNCTDKELIQLAYQVQETDMAVKFLKDEVTKYFDISSVIPYWEYIPGYTMFFIGGGIEISSPEHDIFRSMCWFNDEAMRLYSELIILQPSIDTGTFDYENYRRVNNLYHVMCRQVIINAYFVVEAYLNSIAHSYMEIHEKDLQEDKRLFLSEQKKDKDGRIRKRFISIEDKLYEWVKLISPRGEALDRGKSYNKKFIQMKKYRDAIVHFSGEKVSIYRSIGINTVKDTVLGLIQVVDEINKCIANDPENVVPLWWLHKPDKEGLFNLASEIHMDLMKPRSI